MAKLYNLVNLLKISGNLINILAFTKSRTQISPCHVPRILESMAAITTGESITNDIRQEANIALLEVDKGIIDIDTCLKR